MGTFTITLALADVLKYGILGAFDHATAQLREIAANDMELIKDPASVEFSLTFQCRRTKNDSGD